MIALIIWSRNTSTLASRKHRESDPNEPPKKCKTRHSKVSSEEMDVNEHEADTVELKDRDGKSGRRAKKAGRYVLPLIFLSFPSFFLVHLLTTSIYSRKTAVDKNRDVASFQDNNHPLSRLVFFSHHCVLFWQHKQIQMKAQGGWHISCPPQRLRLAQSTAPLILPVSTCKRVKNRADKKKADEKSEVTDKIEKDEENDKDEDSIEDDDSAIHHANERGAGTPKAVPAIQYVLTPFFSSFS